MKPVVLLHIREDSAKIECFKDFDMPFFTCGKFEVDNDNFIINTLYNTLDTFRLLHEEGEKEVNTFINLLKNKEKVLDSLAVISKYIKKKNERNKV